MRYHRCSSIRWYAWVVKQEQQTIVKVRIKVAPAEREIDGINLKRFTPGSVREVSPTTGAWLVAVGYADPEMRDVAREEDQFYSERAEPPPVAHNRRGRSRS